MVETTQIPEGYNAGSLTSIYIEMLFNNNVLSYGTAFIAHRKHPTLRVLLFTARHNLTGKDHFTEKCLCTDAAVPNKIRAWMPRCDSLTWNSIEVPILSSDGNEPRWQEHPTFGCKVDIAALPLNQSDLADDILGFSYGHISDSDHDFDEYNFFDVGRQVHIVGFPLKMKGIFHAIWTTGFVATDPRVDFPLPNKFGALPCFLVSARTWSGQSGSPVFAHASSHPSRRGSSWLRSAGSPDLSPHMYTGRLNPPNACNDPAQSPTDRLSADLGIVWKSSLLGDILNAES